jgi:hypothetical protein
MSEGEQAPQRLARNAPALRSAIGYGRSARTPKLTRLLFICSRPTCSLRAMSGSLWPISAPLTGAGTHEACSRLKAAILKHCVAPGRRGSTITMFAVSADGTSPFFVEIPPSSSMRLAGARLCAGDRSRPRTSFAWPRRTAKYPYASEPHRLPGKLSWRSPRYERWPTI